MHNKKFNLTSAASFVFVALRSRYHKPKQLRFGRLTWRYGASELRAFLFLLLLASSYLRAAEIQFFDVAITIGDSWSYSETATGAEISISKSETLSLNIMQAPQKLSKDQIYGGSDPEDFSDWGEFYGSTSRDINSMSGKTKHSWLLYNGNYILLAQYISDNPENLNLVKKCLQTLKRVAP